MRAPPPAPSHSVSTSGAAFILKKALISAFVALVLFSLMIGVRTEAGPEGHLIYWTRFGDLAAIVAVVFGGSIIIELLRQCTHLSVEARRQSNAKLEYLRSRSDAARSLENPQILRLHHR